MQPERRLRHTPARMARLATREPLANLSTAPGIGCGNTRICLPASKNGRCKTILIFAPFHRRSSGGCVNN